jgi:hypothetical protein
MTLSVSQSGTSSELPQPWRHPREHMRERCSVRLLARSEGCGRPPVAQRAGRGTHRGRDLVEEGDTVALVHRRAAWTEALDTCGHGQRLRQYGGTSSRSEHARRIEGSKDEVISGGGAPA